MNRLIFALLAALTASHPAVAHEGHGQPQFGGVVAEAGVAQFEIVAGDGKVTVHATQHGAPLATAGASGRLTVLDGTRKSEIELAPAGENRLAGAGRVPSGARLLLNVSLAGQKPLQARAVLR